MAAAIIRPLPRQRLVVVPDAGARGRPQVGTGSLEVQGAHCTGGKADANPAKNP
jgi:hypothetical protein